jgi:hypothetical protein
VHRNSSEKLITIQDSKNLIHKYEETEIVVRIRTDNEYIIEEISLPAKRRKNRINANYQYDERRLF